MTQIEEALNGFLDKVNAGVGNIPEHLIEEFGERCKDILRKNFTEETAPKAFSLRMSNIGRPLRSLILSKNSPQRGKPTNAFKLKATIGHVYEAFMLTLLKASGAGLEEQDKQVKLKVGKDEICGTLDIIINGVIYDIKTASAYAYEHKFDTFEHMQNGDSFGYIAQGCGYALAEGKTFGGWLVINKNTGEFKVLEVPVHLRAQLMQDVYKEIQYKVRYINNNLPAPACKGVIREMFRKKPTGNLILNNSCKWCDHKNTCHPGIRELPEAFSTAAVRKTQWYIGDVNYPEKKKKGTKDDS